MSYNKTRILGNLTRDPEIHYTAKGNAIAKLGIAVSRKWKSDSGMQEKTTFIDVTAFGKQAETVSQYLKKGPCSHPQATRLHQSPRAHVFGLFF